MPPMLSGAWLSDEVLATKSEKQNSIEDNVPREGSLASDCFFEIMISATAIIVDRRK